MDDFLAKPAGLRDIARMIDRWAPPGKELRSENAPAVVAHDAFNADALGALVDDLGGSELVVRLVESYLAELDERRRALVEAIASGGLDVLHRVGHTLRSTSEMVGAVELAAVCRRLEAASEQRDAETLLDEFAAAADRAESTLTAWIHANSGVIR
jgi:HPt (histidine-containing phosphotransfer) domain-containing protein